MSVPRIWAVALAAVLATACGGSDAPTASSTSATASASTSTSVPYRQPDQWIVGPDAPIADLGGLAVSAGDVVVVGTGGCCSMLPGPELAAYDPTVRAWTTLPPYPTGCGPGDAVWTGTELIAFGGRMSAICDAVDSVANRSVHALDPVAKTWRDLAEIPVSLQSSQSVWTGRELIVLGQLEFDENRPRETVLLRYDPEADSWLTAAAPPGEARQGAAVVWSDDLLLVWGGTFDSPDAVVGSLSLRDGAAYDPEADVWTAIPAAPSGGAALAVSAWTGRELLVWGGEGTEGDGARREARSAGAAYDPVAKRWRVIAEAPTEINDELRGLEFFAGDGAWTGAELVVTLPRLGDDGAGDQDLLGAAYDPELDTWRSLPSDSGMAVVGSVVWTGRSVGMFGGFRVGEDLLEGTPPRLVELVANEPG